MNFLPTASEHLGRFGIVFLVLNRAIGSGIFIQPANILSLTRSTGVSILIWIVGGVIASTIALTWLELATAAPYYVLATRRHWILRSGGDKNYVGWPVRCAILHG